MHSTSLDLTVFGSSEHCKIDRLKLQDIFGNPCLKQCRFMSVLLGRYPCYNFRDEATVTKINSKSLIVILDWNFNIRLISDYLAGKIMASDSWKKTVWSVLQFWRSFIVVLVPILSLPIVFQGEPDGDRQVKPSNCCLDYFYHLKMF